MSEGRAWQFSVVVPVHDEADLLESTIARMLDELRPLGDRLELLICENGSTDRSLEIARRIASSAPDVTLEHLPVGDYGLAIKHAIAACRHDFVVVYNLDFWSASFARESLTRLGTADMVLGSKVMPGASDRRPIVRRLITRAFNAFLKTAFGFRGTDTHGMKALRRSAILPVLQACESSGWLFDTELVLRAERAGLRIAEIPVAVAEVRPPTYASIAGRFPRVIVGLAGLWRALRRVPEGTRTS